jgi:hypothetical protein
VNPVRKVTARSPERWDNLQRMEARSIRLETADINRFWHAVDRSTAATARDIFQTEYFDKASPGLRDFIASRVGSVEELLANFHAKPQYFAAIRAQTLRVETLRPAIEAMYSRLIQLFGDTVIPAVYFVIGRMNSGGTLSVSSVQIGMEFYAIDQSTPLHELNAWERGVVMPLETLPFIVAHELVHFQHMERFTKANGASLQREMTLLEAVYVEGLAEYFGEAISGRVVNPEIHRYGRQHEAALLERFRIDMHGNDSSNWLYQGSKATAEPADLGYFIGYGIVKAYFEGATDRTQALETLLTTTDVLRIVEESRYFDSV